MPQPSCPSVVADHVHEFAVLKRPPQSPSDLYRISWDVVKWESDIMDVHTNICEESVQHLVKSISSRINAVLKENVVHPSTSKVYVINRPVRCI